MGTLNLQTIVDDAARAGAQNPGDRVNTIKAALAADGIGRDDVEKLLTEAASKFEALNATDPVDSDSLDALEILSEVVTTARTTTQAIDARSEEVRARRDELAAQVLGGDTDAAADSADDKATDPADDTDGGADVVAEAEAATEAAAAPVTAAAVKRFDLASIKPKPETAPATDTKTGMSITAAAGVRGVENGANLDLDGLVAAARARIDGMPRGRGGSGTVVKDGIAQIKVAYPDSLVASGSNDAEVVQYAGDQTRLNGGIVASGGWCAPSETLYELGDNLADPSAGLVDVPDIQVTRGGIRYTEGASFADVWAGDVGLVQTETQAEANTLKSLYRPSCPEFQEKRLDVIYSGLIVGFLQNDAYPEVTRDALANVTAVHAHRVNAETLSRMTAGSTAVDLTKLGPSATGSILNGIGLSLMDAKYRLRASESLVLDVVLPIWAKEIVRADYSLREGIPLQQVGDQQITDWIAARGGRVQWVYDWQDAYTGVTGGFGSATAITEYPTEVNALVHPSGTFVRGRGEVVNLDMVYDSTMTKSNDYLQMFMEEKLLVVKRRHFSQKVKLALGVNGTVGAPQALDGNGKIVPPAAP